MRHIFQRKPDMTNVVPIDRFIEFGMRFFPSACIVILFFANYRGPSVLIEFICSDTE